MLECSENLLTTAIISMLQARESVETNHSILNCLFQLYSSNVDNACKFPAFVNAAPTNTRGQPRLLLMGPIPSNHDGVTLCSCWRRHEATQQVILLQETTSRSVMKAREVSTKFGEALEQVAQRCGGCPIPRDSQDQAGWASEQPD